MTSNSLGQRALGAGQALKQDFDRRAALQAGQLRLDVREHADLRRRAGGAAQLVEVPQHGGDVVDRVDRRVEADQGVARRQRQPPVDQQRDAAQVVGRMVRLQARGQRAGQAQRRAGPAGARHFLRQQHQLVHVANLGHGGRHRPGQRPAERRDLVGAVADSRWSLNSPTVMSAIEANTSRSMS